MYDYYLKDREVVLYLVIKWLFKININKPIKYFISNQLSQKKLWTNGNLLYKNNTYLGLLYNLLPTKLIKESST